MILLSAEPLANRVLFSLKQTQLTESKCPSKLNNLALSLIFQRITLPSSAPLAKNLALVSKHKEFIGLICSFKLNSSRILAKSKIFIDLSQLPLASLFPSALKHTDLTESVWP